MPLSIKSHVERDIAKAVKLYVDIAHDDKTRDDKHRLCLTKVIRHSQQ